MKNHEIAIKFVRSFCAGDVEALAVLLADDFRLRGPLFRFDSREAYLNSLRSNGLEQGDVKVLSVTEGEDMVSIYYEYKKKAGTVTIAQLFRLHGERIVDTLVVFDSNESM